MELLFLCILILLKKETKQEIVHLLAFHHLFLS